MAACSFVAIVEVPKLEVLELHYACVRESLFKRSVLVIERMLDSLVGGS